VAGISLPSILDNDQKIATNLIRLVQDSAALDCYKNPVTNDQQMFQSLQVRKPFAVIKGDPGKLGEVKTSPPSQFILKAYEMHKAEVEEKTGITRYNQGMDASSLNKTATGIDAIMSASAKPLRLIAKIIGNGAIRGLIRDFIEINIIWPEESKLLIESTGKEITPEMLMKIADIDIDIGVGAAEKNAMANQIELMIQFATSAGIQMGIMTPTHVARMQKKKYRLLGVKVEDLMMSDQEIAAAQKAAEEAKAANPPDIKEYCQIDKIYPMLTPIEQQQVLNAFGIKPDPKRLVLPPQALSGESPLEIAKLQLEIQKTQMEAKKYEQDMAFRTKEMQMKMADSMTKAELAKAGMQQKQKPQK
jgi:transcriptional regulator with XRE-family HTH domain